MSVVCAHVQCGLSCPAVCAIFVPEPGIELEFPVGRQILNQGFPADGEESASNAGDLGSIPR